MEFLKWWPDYGYTKRTVLVSALRESQLPSGERVGSSLPAKQTTVGSGGFFVYRARDYAALSKISRRSLHILHFINSPKMVKNCFTCDEHHSLVD